MKMTIHSFCFAASLLTVVAALACGSLAWAQGAAVGHFVLPVDVQWNGATLPAGQYHFTLPSGRFGGILLIRDGQEKGKMLVVTEGKGTRPNHSALTIVRRKGQWHVASLALDFMGTTLMYWVPSQTKVERETEASIQVIPVRIVKG